MIQHVILRVVAAYTRDACATLSLLGLVALYSAPAIAQDSSPLPAALRKLGTDVFSDEDRTQHRSMWLSDVRRRRTAANEASVTEWKRIQNLDDWQRFAPERIERLAASLGEVPRPAQVELHVTRTLEGDGYRIRNALFNSRPGLWIAANLYEPTTPSRAMPGILICHSHHTPKTHGELQDMGMTWARLGCLVLVMDQIGHGERRAHPYQSAADDPRPFRVGRQDYYFRYDLGIQFHLAGESLIGQMAHDLRRGVDLLLSRPGIDPRRIALLGSVAGGGDPVAVTAALDERIAVAAPFNFGGPQPETRFPLPEDAELAFNYVGGGSWESTRNLRRSASDGFLPWVIVGSIAPRRLIYAHEFAWDRDRDPVWRRLNEIYTWHGAADGLDWVSGHGRVTLSSQEASHCTHIGQLHRRRIHTALDRWFAIRDGEKSEYRGRRPDEELMCWTDDLRERLRPTPVHEVLAKAARDRQAAHGVLDEPPQPEADQHLAYRQRIQANWRQVLGEVDPIQPPRIRETRTDDLSGGAGRCEYVELEVEPGIAVPLVLLKPAANSGHPVVVAVAQGGKQAFLRERADEVATLLERDIAVCLVDVRGTGETRPDDGRERQSSATSLSSSELMLGATTVGSRLRDVRSVITWLRGRTDIAADRIAIWGDSCALPNAADENLAAPRGIASRPRQSEPLGGLLALFTALFDDQIRAVHIHGGLTRFADVLDSPFVWIPHDAVVPGAIAAGDLPHVAAAIAPTPIRLDHLVDGGNRPASREQIHSLYPSSGRRDASDNLSPGEWLAERLAP